MDNNYIAHEGVQGQKWGVRNGPPYPLDYDSHSEAEKKHITKKEYRKYERAERKYEREAEREAKRRSGRKEKTKKYNSINEFAGTFASNANKAYESASEKSKGNYDRYVKIMNAQKQIYDDKNKSAEERNAAARAYNEASRMAAQEQQAYKYQKAGALVAKSASDISSKELSAYMKARADNDKADAERAKQIRYQTNAKSMSDDELRDITKRLQLEKTYKQLIDEDEHYIKAGANKSKEILAGITTVAALAMTGIQIANGIQQLKNNKVGS